MTSYDKKLLETSCIFRHFYQWYFPSKLDNCFTRQLAANNGVGPTLKWNSNEQNSNKAIANEYNFITSAIKCNSNKTFSFIVVVSMAAWSEFYFLNCFVQKIWKWNRQIYLKINITRQWIIWSLCDTMCWLSSSPPNAAYMCQWIGTALIQIMAWHQFSAKTLSKPMLGYCQLEP